MLGGLGDASAGRRRAMRGREAGQPLITGSPALSGPGLGGHVGETRWCVNGAVATDLQYQGRVLY